MPKKAATKKPEGLPCVVVGPTLRGVRAGGTVHAATVAEARKWRTAGLVRIPGPDRDLTDGDLVALLEAGHP